MGGPKLTFAMLVAATLLGQAPAVGAPSGHICIRDQDIDHTEIPDDQTILFHMRDGAVYRNALSVRCVGLKNATAGFTYEPTDPGTNELCDYLGMFRVNTGFGGAGLAATISGGGGQVCNFGKFTQTAGPTPR